MEVYKNIKPLSVNKCWAGKRFKTNDYKVYEAELLYTLPALQISDKIPLRLTIEVGFSNRSSDLSNILKPFEDILCKKYGIDDRWNYEIFLRKKIVKKGDDYISFSFKEIDIDN